MRVFKNIKSGMIYHITNNKLVAGYENRPDLYLELIEQVKELKPVYEDYTNNDLKSMLDARGIYYTKKATKNDLISLLNN